jgi:hypothetical protein
MSINGVSTDFSENPIPFGIESLAVWVLRIFGAVPARVAEPSIRGRHSKAENDQQRDKYRS